MTPLPPDGSRDRRIEDWSNLLLIHPLAAWLLPRAIARGVSANMASLAGLALGIGAAFAFGAWRAAWAPLVGLVLAVGWLVADGLDGKIARATGTATRLGRLLDGVVDHGVFILIYAELADSIGTAEAWVLAVSAGAAHAVQSILYEGERTRFHRRLRLEPAARADRVAGYDHLANAIDRWAAPFDRALEALADRRGGADSYAARAARAMRLETLLSANTRVIAITLACALARPMLFWWFELTLLSLVALAGIAWHRRIEARALYAWRGGGLAAGVP